MLAVGAIVRGAVPGTITECHAYRTFLFVERGKIVFQVLVAIALFRGVEGIELVDDVTCRVVIEHIGRGGVQEGRHGMPSQGIQPSSAQAQHLQQGLARECVLEY